VTASTNSMIAVFAAPSFQVLNGFAMRSNPRRRLTSEPTDGRRPQHHPGGVNTGCARPRQLGFDQVGSVPLKRVRRYSVHAETSVCVDRSSVSALRLHGRAGAT
jgi:hypothetical protein